MATGFASRYLQAFANTLLSVGLPQVRAFLQSRLGPDVQLREVSLDGTRVHLDGGVIPIGKHIVLEIDRATITLVRGVDIAPDLRLVSLRASLRSTTGLSARVQFEDTHSGAVEQDVWVDGRVDVRELRWRPDLEPSLQGTMNVRVQMDKWSLQQGVFSRGSMLLRVDAKGDLAGSGMAAVTSARCELVGSHARDFLDAAQSILARPVDTIVSLPAETTLDGTIAWTVSKGMSTELRVRARSTDVLLHAEITTQQSIEVCTVKGQLALGDLGLPQSFKRWLSPNADATSTLDVSLEGSVTRPILNGTFGVPLCDPLPRVDAVVHIPLRGEPSETGTVSLVMGDSRVVLTEVTRKQPGWYESPIEASLRIEDVLALDILPAVAAPVKGEPLLVRGVLAGELRALVFEGELSCAAFLLGFEAWPMHPVSITQAKTLLSVSSERVTMRDLECTAFETAWQASVSSSEEPVVHLQFADASGALLQWLCATQSVTAPRWLVEIARVTAELDIARSGAMAGSFACETGVSTVVGKLHRTPDAGWTGTQLRGRVSVQDLVRANVVPESVLLDPRDRLQLNARVAIDDGELSLLGSMQCAQLMVALPSMHVAPTPITRVSAQFSVNRVRLYWSALHARVLDGDLHSTGRVALGEASMPLQLRVTTDRLAIAQLRLLNGVRIDEWISGALTSSWTLTRKGGRGRVALYDPEYHGLSKAESRLARVGLPLPDAFGTEPMIADVTLREGAMHLEQVLVSLNDGSMEGSVRLGWDTSVLGSFALKVSKTYLKQSMLLSLPAAMLGDVTVPVGLSGTISNVHVNADFKSALGWGTAAEPARPIERTVLDDIEDFFRGL